MSSIDAVQDRVESLNVLLFEALRSHDAKDPAVKEKVANSIKKEYKAAIHEIDNLTGAGRSPSEQESELEELAQLQTVLKSDILSLQDKILSLNKNCNSELSTILNDPLCKCERN